MRLDLIEFLVQRPSTQCQRSILDVPWHLIVIIRRITSRA